LFSTRFRVTFDRLRRLAKGDSRDYAPISPIKFSARFKVRVARLRRFAMGDSRDKAPFSPIVL